MAVSTGRSCPTPAFRNTHRDRLKWVVSGPLVTRHIDKAARRLDPAPVLPYGGSSYSEEGPWEETLQHGEVRLRIVAVPGRLCRRRGGRTGIAAAWSGTISSLLRMGARPERQCVRSPHVRGDALLGRRPS